MNKKILIGTIILLLIVLSIISIFYYNKKITQTNHADYIKNFNQLSITTSNSALNFNCYGNMPIINALKKELGIKNISVSNHDSALKRATDEPYLMYIESSDSYSIFLENTFKKEKDLNNTLVRLLSGLKTKQYIYEVDPINTIYEPENWFRLALRKKSTIYRDTDNGIYDELYLLEPYVVYSNNDAHIEISCYENSVSNEIIRNTLLEINQVAKYQPDDVLSILEIGESALRLEVGGIMAGGGHSDYWFKINGNWKRVFSGSIDPACSAINKYHVGKGIICYCDSNDSSTCNNVVDY